MRVLIEIAGVLLAAALFCAASLFPHRHLVGGEYLLRFGLFALLLGALFFTLTWGARVLLIKGSDRGVWLVPAASLLLFLGAFVCNRQPPPNVILLVLDSLRADHLGCYGYERPTSPNLDRFAKDALRFERCFSQSAGTDKSLPAIFASIYPSMFYDPLKDGDNFYVPGKFTLLSQHMKELGYLTWGFSANPKISRSMNYARGYDEFAELWRRDCRPHDLKTYFMEKVEASKGDEFLLAGLIIEPHTPYAPKPEFNVFGEDRSRGFSELLELGMKTGFPMEIVRRLRDLYDGEILEADDALGEFLAWLMNEGHYDRSLILITSDHGEAFKEHGALGHGGVLYEVRIHIPLIAHFPSPLKFPELKPRGTYSPITSHVDFMPTVMGFLGIELRDEHAQGRNLIPYIYGKESAPEGDVFLEELIHKNAVRCLRTGEWKLIRRETDKKPKEDETFLYAIGRDPGEKENLAGRAESMQVEQAMLAELRKRTGNARRFYTAKGQGIELDRETLMKLNELGYGK